ncbi:phasin [Pararhizobium haloflavum]|uniref:phasin n=1 Tax=Pararhizobium haloflavum TaxID=2037914 RepID=UPI000C1905CE|nr:phasin [Pararhizobium haloflavum]
MATTKKTTDAEIFSFPAFDPAKVTDTYREFAEKGVAQSKEAYAKMKTAAEDATKTMETTMETAQAGTVELGLKAIDQMRVNTESTFSHMEALLGVKSVAEMIELQSSFLRKQVETGVDQAKSWQESVRKVSEDVTKPGKSAVEKTMKDVKVA